MNPRKLFIQTNRRFTQSTRKSKLARRLLTVVFSLYFGIALTTTIIQLSVEYNHEKEDLGKEVSRLYALFEPILANSTWNLDEENVHSTLKSISQYPAIKGVSLRGDFEIHYGQVEKDGGTVYFGDSPDNEPQPIQSSLHQLIPYDFPVTYIDDQGKDHDSGAVIVYTSTEVLIHRLKVIFITTIGSAAIKTFFLWLILYWVLNIMVGQPLTRITRSINLMASRESGSRKIADSKKTKDEKRTDELHFLMKSFVHMQRQLRRKRKEIERHQHELEEKVRLRTEQLQYRASHDELTGLLNRGEFEKRACELLITKETGQHIHSLAFIDLDRFKLVNDTLGHAAGDQLLREITAILQKGVRESDLVARIGGDEFAILLPNCEIDRAENYIESIRSKIESTKFIAEGKTFTIGMSAGLVVITEDNQTLSSALRSADTACYIAKESGRNQVQIYEKTDNKRRFELYWVSAIKEAIEHDKFVLFFQPIFSGDQTQSLNFTRFEILLRMRDDNGEILAPDSFMPAAERYRLITKIDYWVVEHVFLYLKENRHVLEAMEMVFINLSGASLSDSNLSEFITFQAENCGVPLEKVCFEITETAKIPNFSKALELIYDLHEAGALFALDDFGSGISSYDYLKEIPVDIVKIYGGFVQNILEDPVDATIVESIRSISHTMGKKVVAEFVETVEISELLIKLEIDFLQGYGLQKPQAITHLEECLTNEENKARA